jgi:hypothetical protein
MLRTIDHIPLAHREPAAHHSRSAAAVWLLAAALVAVAACGTVDAAPSAENDAGGNGAASVGGAPGGAGGAGGSGGAGEAGHAGAPGISGTTGGAGEGGHGGAPSSGGMAGAPSSGGTGGARLGVSDVACPYDWAVQRGCPGQNVNGSPCDVCHDAGGAPLRCSTNPAAGARAYCVPDCSQCY